MLDKEDVSSFDLCAASAEQLHAAVPCAHWHVHLYILEVRSDGGMV